MNTMRVGFAGLVHDHVWGELERWQAIEGVELVAAGDVNDDLLQRIGERGGVKHLFTSWQEMLGAAGDAIDVVQIASENNQHAEIVEACAERGLSCILEKPMAATLAQAERIVRAAEAGNITVLVNWPSAWGAAWQEMERRISAGEIGDVRYFKYRSAHNGPREIGCDPHFVAWLYNEEKNGAGAFMDYCCYGAAMAAHFLGLPQSVVGMRDVLVKEYPLPDDNGFVAMKYPHAYAVAEASWTQPMGYITPNPYAYGSEGAIAVAGNMVILDKPGQARQEIVPAPTEFPMRSGPEYLLHCIETKTAPHGLCSVETSRNAQEILEAGLIAARTGQTQTLPLHKEPSHGTPVHSRQ